MAPSEDCEIASNNGGESERVVRLPFARVTDDRAYDPLSVQSSNCRQLFTGTDHGGPCPLR